VIPGENKFKVVFTNITMELEGIPGYTVKFNDRDVSSEGFIYFNESVNPKSLTN
jgi:hypothetical protein